MTDPVTGLPVLSAGTNTTELSSKEVEEDARQTFRDRTVMTKLP